MPTGPYDHLIDFFDEFAPNYEQWAGGLHPRVAAKLVELAAPQKGESALDVGTGTGLVANAVAQAVGKRGQAIGIDVSEGMMRIGRAAKPPVAEFIGMAGERVVFRDGTFDLVTFGDVLTYLADPAAALGEAARVLRPGGRVALSVPRRALHTSGQDRFFEVLEDFLERHPLRIPRVAGRDRIRFGEPELLTDILETFGFEGVQTSTLMTGWRLQGGRAWIEHMLGAGPFTHATLSALGARLRDELAGELDVAMGELGEEGQRAHHAYTLAIAHPRRQ
ncbi:MAG TPA: methyltransferase domain-containing protein [Candidatus Dormibacteraeota bacterium]